MKPVGMCRMCLVEIETPRGKVLTTSCTTLVSDGMGVETESPVVKKAQEGVLEFLLVNHPLDCPVCDRGGECPLQDHTVAFGPGESRFVEEKRHFEKPIEISDLVYLDRERCILCARCTRFSEEISGDALIEFKDRGNGTQIQTFPDEPFTSYFSVNTVEICPVGALTARPYRFRARPWDLEAVESVSLVDTVHSKASVQSSMNELVRINGIDSEPTSHGWLSDKDRFMYQYVNSPERLTDPLVRDDNGDLVKASWGEALDLVADRLAQYPGFQVAGIGGARGTNEESYAFGKFMRTVIVSPHVDAQLGDGLDPQFLVGANPRARISDLETARAILLWAGDLKEELPVLYLRVRRAVTALGATLIVVHPRRTGLGDVASHKFTYRPGAGSEMLNDLAKGRKKVFRDLRAELASGPVVTIVGRTGLTEDPRLAEAVAAFARDLPQAKLMPIVRRGNTFGALDMGLAPTLLPGRVSARNDTARAELETHWGPLPAGEGFDTWGILDGLAKGDLKALVLMGADPVRDFPSPQISRAALDAAEFVVAFDLFLSDSSRLADVVLPVEGFAETEGTVTNLEGRVQKVNRKLPGPGRSRPSWSVLEDLSRRMGGLAGAVSAEAIMNEIATVAPAYRDVTWDALDWGSGRDGIVAESDDQLAYVPVNPNLQEAPADGLSLHLARVLYDDGLLTRMSPALHALMCEPHVYLHPADAADLAVGPGDLVSVTGDQGHAELTVAVDPGLAPQTAYVPFNLPATADLGASASVSLEPVGGGD